MALGAACSGNYQRTRSARRVSSVFRPESLALWIRRKTTSGMFLTDDNLGIFLKPFFSYPDSKWDNVKNNMGSGTTNPPGSTTTSGPTGTPGSGSCAGVTTWSASTVFVGGDKATYSEFRDVVPLQGQVTNEVHRRWTLVDRKMVDSG